MLRQLAVTITETLTTLFAILCLDRIASAVWDWHYRLTGPERQQAADEFFCRVFGRERQQ